MQLPIEVTNIGRRLKAARTMASLTRPDVAGRLGVTEQAISLWERGETVPTLPNLIKLANLYGTSLDHLVGLQRPAA